MALTLVVEQEITAAMTNQIIPVCPHLLSLFLAKPPTKLGQKFMVFVMQHGKLDCSVSLFSTASRYHLWPNILNFSFSVIGFFVRFEDDSVDSAKVVKQWNVKIISVSGRNFSYVFLVIVIKFYFAPTYSCFINCVINLWCR